MNGKKLISKQDWETEMLQTTWNNQNYMKSYVNQCNWNGGNDKTFGHLIYDLLLVSIY